MNLWRLTLRGLLKHRRSHAAVAGTAVVATAVLVGALVVGDSVRSSLRELALGRLGSIEWIYLPGRPLTADFSDRLNNAGFPSKPLVMAPSSVSTRIDGETRRASGATLIGGLLSPEGDFDAAVTEPLAAELGIATGDSLVVRVGSVSTIPGESPLGDKQDTTRSVRLRSIEVIGAEGIARFSLSPSQANPRSVFVPLGVSQQLLELEEKTTAVVVDAAAKSESSNALPTDVASLADLGLLLVDLGEAFWQLESDNLVLTDEAVAAARSAFGTEAVQPATTYLANRIELRDRSIPYSTVTGVAQCEANPAVLNSDGEPLSLGDNEVALTDWAAEDLDASVGDTVTLRFYEPESTHGVLTEAPPVSLRVAAIVPLAGDDGESTTAADPRWTPQLEGVTDADSINDWDLPFELVETIRDQDEDYWDAHSTTPKAFVSETLARRLWQTRWGTTSLVRFRAEGAAAQVESALLGAIDPADFGMEPINLRAQATQAAAGNTPFDVLFLLFSMFLIASACALIALVTRLAIETRSSEAGLLGAVGFTRQTVRKLLLRETLLAVGAGVLVGAIVGIAYAALLLELLRTVWIDAIGTPFMRLHVSPLIVASGATFGFVVAAITAWRVVTSATKAPPKKLIHSRGSELSFDRAQHGRKPLVFIGLALAIAAGSLGAGRNLQGEAAAGAFFAAGASVLSALMTAGWLALTPKRRDAALKPSFWRLAMADVARYRGRSLLVAGLVAGASFLVLATSAFRLTPTAEGVGGFAIVAESDLPILYDLDDEDGRFELGFSSKDEEMLADWQAVGLRVQPGEDASCRNMYQPRRPRVLGAPRRLMETAAPFSWAASSAVQGSEPWSVLDVETPSEEPLPVVLDFNTAVYSLKLYGGIGEVFEIEDATGKQIAVRVAGLLKNSVLQGDLLMGEQDFLRLYPQTSGERFFLLSARKQSDAAAMIALLEDRLSDFGFDAELTEVRLARFLAVQNTYLSTFQSLGAFGLLLGVAGLTIAQYRNLVERRGELALMRAAGYPTRRLGRLVLASTVLMVGGGLAAGMLATAVALSPLYSSQGGTPPTGTALGLATLLLGTAVVAGRLASQSMLRAPLHQALRGD